MDSIKICISIKCGSKITKVYVKIFGAYTLLGVISQFDYIWGQLTKDEKFSLNGGYVVSIKDADDSTSKPSHFVRV